MRDSTTTHDYPPYDAELEVGPAPEAAEQQVRLRLESVSGDIDLVRVHGAATAEVPQPPSPATAD